MKLPLHRGPGPLAPLLFAVLLGFTRALAQIAPTPNASPRRPDADDAALKLSPFVVSTDRDTGYIAADTLSAGRLSTNLLMTPGAIDVLTRDLINDLGVFNIDEASGWLTSSRPLELGAIEGNSVNPSGLALDDSATNVSLRGFTGQPSTRNYFQSGTTPKEYNVERIESARGPNAILYGEGGPGGQVNYITKRAQGRNFNTLRLRGDSLWSKGVALDLNRKLREDLFFRYNTNWLDQRYYISGTRFKNTGHAANAFYRPFERTTVSVDLDVTRSTRPGLIMAYADQYSRWNQVPVTAKMTAAAATAAGLLAWPATFGNVWVEGQGMQDQSGWPHSIGWALPLQTEYAFPDLFANVKAPPARSFNANPKQNDVVDRTTDLQVSFDHTFRNKLSLQVAGQYSKYRGEGGNSTFGSIYQDVLLNLPDGSGPNPNYGKLFSYAALGRNLNAEREGKTVRLVAAYPLTFLGGTTNLSALVHRQQRDTVTRYSDPHIVVPGSTLPITAANSMIQVFRYLDNLPETMPDFRKMYNIVDVPTADGRVENRNDAVMLAASGSYLHDTLSIIAGFRRDKSELTTRNGVVAARDAVTGQFNAYTVEARSAYNNVVTAGLVYFPTKLVGVYANHAEGFQIQTVSTPRLDGSFGSANIVPAKDRSYGLRFNLLQTREAKLVGSIGYYEVEQSNSALAIGVGAVNTLWQNHGRPELFIETFDSNPTALTNTNAINSSRSYRGWGWEASLVANMGKALRLTVNAALPKTSQSDVGTDYLAYVSQYLPQWTQWANDPANPTRVSDTTSLNTINGQVSGFQEGRAQNYTYKYRYNAYGVYTFQDAPIKGLRAGLGAQLFGAMIIGNEIGLPYNYVYRKSYYMMTGNLGYTFKFKKQNVDVQLNVDNLLNYDEPLTNGLFTFTNAGVTANVPYGFKFPWPRAARLTVTIPF